MSGQQDLHQFDLIDEIEEAVCFLSEEWQIVFANDRLGEILGGSAGKYLGKDFRSLFPSDRLEALEIAYHKAFAEGQTRLQIGMTSALHHEPIPILLRLVRYSDIRTATRCLYAIILDLSEMYEAMRAQEFLRQRNRELEDMAITDPLTGVYNRRYFDYRFAEEMNRARRYQHGIGLAMLDLDHFKQINDQYGHRVGDEVLRLVSRSLRKITRNTDVLARYGGDEYAVILPEILPPGALALGMRMRMCIQKDPLPTQAGPIHITVSIGVSCLNPPEEDISDEELLRRADDTLYRSKQSGRNRVMLWGHPI
jgi:diguanylate cyclase (GGDEF)-like protein